MRFALDKTQQQHRWIHSKIQRIQDQRNCMALANYMTNTQDYADCRHLCTGNFVQAALIRELTNTLYAKIMDMVTCGTK